MALQMALPRPQQLPVLARLLLVLLLQLPPPPEQELVQLQRRAWEAQQVQIAPHQALPVVRGQSCHQASREVQKGPSQSPRQEQQLVLAQALVQGRQQVLVLVLVTLPVQTQLLVQEKLQQTPVSAEGLGSSLLLPLPWRVGQGWAFP